MPSWFGPCINFVASSKSQVFRNIMSDFEINAIRRSAANDFFSRFEILGNVGLGVWHWGLYRLGHLQSVVTFGTPCFGGKRGWISDIAESNNARVLQLCRGGTIPRADTGVPSKAISLACRSMRELVGPFVAVAYADESLGEIGTIYQAAGAIYTGMTKPKGQANYTMGGKMLSAWQVRRKYGTRDRTKLRKIDPGVEIHLLRPKHRYVFVSAARLMKRRITKQFSIRSEPYPQRGENFRSSACSITFLRSCEIEPRRLV